MVVESVVDFLESRVELAEVGAEGEVVGKLVGERNRVVGL